MNRRRSRYTANLASGEQRVILAYDAASVRNHYERQGHTVLSVRKGDFRQEQRIQAIKSEGRPGVPSTLGIRAAAKALGLRYPVEVKLCGRKSNTLGSHLPVVTGNRMAHPDSAGFKHVIKVKSWLPAERMAQTIRHELEHAVQFERECAELSATAAEAFALRKRIYFNGVGYQAKRWEREARAAEATAAGMGLVR